MAHDISSICDFLFGSIRTNVLMDTVDVELTVWMVKGIYTYRKDHTAESTIFTLWSKMVTPSPAYDVQFRHIMMIREERECCHGVIMVTILSSSLPLQWHRLTWEGGLLAKSKPGSQTKTDTTPWRLRDPIPQTHWWPIWTQQTQTRWRCHLSVKVCERFGLSCLFCEQSILHPSSEKSEWSDRDLTGEHTNTQK